MCWRSLGFTNGIRGDRSANGRQPHHAGLRRPLLEICAFVTERLKIMRQIDSRWPENAVTGKSYLRSTTLLSLDVATTWRSIPRNATNSSGDSVDNCSRRPLAVSMSFAASSHWNVPLRSFFKMSNCVLIVPHPHLDGLGLMSPRHFNGVSYLPLADATTWRVFWHNTLYSPSDRAANCLRRSLAACKSSVAPIHMNIPPGVP